MKEIIIIGAGSGGRLLAQLIGQQESFGIAGFIDDNKKLRNKSVCKLKVLGTSKDLKKFAGCGFLVSVGTNIKARALLFKKALASKLVPVTFIHRAALVDKSASVGSGSIVLANCYVGPFCKIGRNCFLFTQTVIEHETQVADNVYFSPAVTIAGGVRVQNNVFFGMNSAVSQNLTIGSNALVGAGAMVLEDVPNNAVFAGVPAKFIRKNA